MHQLKLVTVLRFTLTKKALQSAKTMGDNNQKTLEKHLVDKEGEIAQLNKALADLQGKVKEYQEKLADTENAVSRSR